MRALSRTGAHRRAVWPRRRHRGLLISSMHAGAAGGLGLQKTRTAARQTLLSVVIRSAWNSQAMSAGYGTAGSGNDGFPTV